MVPDIFISYSRQCIGFVDDLVHKLQKRGFKVWLDYLNLIPGRPWAGQIDRGLEESELLLLVVSPESISSRSVEVEWRHFLEKKKRIILIIFQAVPLPPELAELEWVDFRGGYASALKKLFRRIESPSAMERGAPQSGFKAPFIVWLSAGMSIITSIYSIFAFWTFLIPWVLIPLPARIFKRNFNFSQTQTALWTLSIALFFTFGLGLEVGFINENADFDYANPYSLYNLALFILFSQVFLIPIISILQLFLLRSRAMQRWGRPEASLTKFANIFYPNISQPKPVHYYIDYALQDSKIAYELETVLKKYGHTPANEIQNAEEVLVLISRFKNDTEADPEKQIVYPILLQRMKVAEKLSQMQWIDFRKGVRNLDAIAKLLPQPEKLLKGLGVRPTGTGQAAMPNIVLALVDFLIIICIVDFGSLLSFIFELVNLHLGFILQYEPMRMARFLLLQFVCLILIGVVIYYMVHSLSERQGWFTSPFRLGLGFFVILCLVTWQSLLGEDIASLFMQYGIPSDTLFADLPLITVVLGGIIVGIVALFRLRVLRCWLPLNLKA